MLSKKFPIQIKKSFFALLAAVTLTTVLLLAGSWFFIDEIQSPEEYKAEVFLKLREMRLQKKAMALAFLRNQYAVVKTVQRDHRYINDFREMLSLFESRKYRTPQFWNLNRKWEEIYVNDFGMFYDILLLDRQGNIFYTIKMEKDFLLNISNSIFQNLMLQESIEKSGRNITFVDYEYYAISGEPASFYIVPIFVDSNRIGTMVFQLSLNEVNRILANYPKRGKTEEVYLVNQKGLMLTESRFLNDDIILNKKINTKAVLNASKEGEGEGLILDYRGKKVFSSYEKFNFEGTAWTIIAEIDEDEVITDLYKIWQNKIFDKILYILNEYSIPSGENNRTRNRSGFNGKRIKADVKEYVSTKGRDQLYTVGVSTCTAISIHYPEKFGYLLHITPTDDIYEISWSEQLLLGRAYTNMIDEVMSRILWFDVYPYERSLLKFTIFSTQPRSLKRAVQKLLQNGAMLAQIKIAYNSSYKTVSVEVDPGEDIVWSFWDGFEGQKNGVLELASVPNLETIFKKAISY